MVKPCSMVILNASNYSTGPAKQIIDIFLEDAYIARPVKRVKLENSVAKVPAPHPVRVHHGIIDLTISDDEDVSVNTGD